MSALDEPLPVGDDKARAVRSMFDSIAPRYDLVNRLMTFRLDVRWRRRTIRDLGLAPGSLIIDLACGTGDFCREMRHEDNGSHRVIGIDLSLGMLAEARTDAPLIQADVLRLPVPDGAVDAVTCGFALRNLVDLDVFFTELQRVVCPGGRIALLDKAEPPNPVLKAGHDLYFNGIVPRLGALLSDGDAYSYLPRSMAYLPEPEVMVTSLQQRGFHGVEHRFLDGGIVQLLLASRD